MPPMVLPSPSDFGAGAFAGWFFTLYAGVALVVVALAWSLWVGFTRRHWLPAILLVSGALCALCEPMLDVLGHLRWANNLPLYAFHNFGIGIPLLVPFSYAVFMGMEPYLIYRVLKKGVTVRQLFALYLLAGLSDAVLETPGLNLHIYQYYGTQPYTLLHFPYWWAFANGASFMTIGFFVWFLEPRLTGRKRLWLFLVAPVGMMVAYFGVGWPHLLALNSTLPVWAKWAVTTAVMAGFLCYIRGIGYAVAVGEATADWSLRRRPAAARPEHVVHV